MFFVTYRYRWPFSNYEVDVAPRWESTVTMMNHCGLIFKDCRRHRSAVRKLETHGALIVVVIALA